LEARKDFGGLHSPEAEPRAYARGLELGEVTPGDERSQNMRGRGRVESGESGVNVLRGSHNMKWYVPWCGRRGVENRYEPKALTRGVARPIAGSINPMVLASPPEQRAARLRRA